MQDVNLKGLGVALVTPFKQDGHIDYAALSRLVDCLLQNGVDYLVVLGTTGETSTLSSEEQKTIVQSVVSQVKGQVPIVVGVSSNCTRTVVQKLETGDFTGVDAILSVVPYYNKPTQEGIYQHYKHIAAATPLPIVLYNVPGRTVVNMTADTTLRIAHECPNVIAIKEASGNLEQVSRIIREKPSGFQLVSGDDAIALELIKLGAAGVISVIGNAFPRQFGRMLHLALAGDYAQAQMIQQQLTELFELLFIDGNPAGIKSLLYQQGFIENELRLPLVPAQASTNEKIREAFILFEEKFSL